MKLSQPKAGINVNPPADWGYLGNARVKRDGVQQNFTEVEVQEYLRCMDSPAYFCKNYIKIIHIDYGLVDFEPYVYQENMFEHFNSNRFSIVLACRQSGKSIAVCAYLLWYACFHPEKLIAILANKGSTAREMLGRISLMLENLPFFLQPGCRALNKGSIEFSHNSKLVASATSGSSIRGKSVSLLYLDEFAFVENAGTFYTSTYPVISSGKQSRVIITSTANGVGNIFHRIWEGAIQKTNEYKPLRVDWGDVPGRDEKWKEETIANTSELQFEQEFGNSFIGTGTTLISSDTLLSLRSENPIYTQGGVRVYQKPIENHNYVMTVDVAKGRNKDYSTFTIIDISVQPFLCVAIYRDNTVSPLLFPDVIYKYAKTYNDAYLIVESNDAGQVVCNALYYDLEYEHMFVESAVKAGAIGATMTKRVKRIGCSNLKDLIEEKRLKVIDIDVIAELSTFEVQHNSYGASDGNHDDLVMNLVLFGWFSSTDIFSEFGNIDLKNLLYAEKLKVIEDELTPVGIMGDLENNEVSRYEVGVDGNLWVEAKNMM